MKYIRNKSIDRVHDSVTKAVCTVKYEFSYFLNRNNKQFGKVKKKMISKYVYDMGQPAQPSYNADSVQKQKPIPRAT